MTLLVADAAARSVPRVLAADADTVSSDAVSDIVAVDDPDVVVVDAEAVRDPAAVVRAVREVSSDAAIVLVGDTDSRADVAGVDCDEASVREAVERAERVADYRRSVSDLYDACRDRALGRPDSEVQAQRRQADDRFSALATDEETFAALFRTDTASEQAPGKSDEADATDAADTTGGADAAAVDREEATDPPDDSDTEDSDG